MSDQHEKTLKVLNDLISSCNESWEGFAKAAKGAHSRHLSDWLAEISKKRLEFAHELAITAAKLGGKPTGVGHSGERLHKGWADLEARIHPQQDTRLRELCAEGEEATLKHYVTATALPLPGEIRPMIEQQLHEIRETIGHLRGRHFDVATAAH